MVSKSRITKNRAEIAFYKEKCDDCRKCIAVCPTNAIDKFTKISNYSICIACGACVDICPNDARKMIGQILDEETIVSELLKDIDFYDNSNGGVTFSGGEPLVHPEFIHRIIKELKKYDIHINIETSGYFNFKKVLPLLPFIDLIYFDIKHLDNDKHKEYTGVSNGLILSNFEALNKVFKNIQVRIPLIPGVNDTPENIKIMSNFLIEKGYKTVHLLPYHSMGNSKALRIDYPYELFKVEPNSKENIALIKSQFSKFGIKPITYD